MREGASAKIVPLLVLALTLTSCQSIGQGMADNPKTAGATSRMPVESPAHQASQPSAKECRVEAPVNARTADPRVAARTGVSKRPKSVKSTR